MEIIAYPRRSGRTFRVALEAAKQASRGERVVVWCASHFIGMHFLYVLRQITRVIEDVVTAVPNGMKIGEGCVSIAVDGADIRGTVPRNCRHIQLYNDSLDA